MKFTNGYWMERAGLESCYATQVVEIEKQGSELVVYAATRITKSRGDTLNAPLLTIRYSSPMKNIIKVRISHFEGALDRGPAFETSKERAFKPEIELASEGASLKTGDLEVCLEKKESWMVRYFGNQKPLTKNETKSTAYLRLDGASFVKEELALGVAECVYGLGERFGPFVKNGQSIDIWNADGGTASEQAYKNIPFYLSSKGYGIFVNNAGRVSFEIASEKNSRVQFSVPGESLEYFVIYGADPKAVLER
jgi:alpha-D-xyloside xylohydrolase